MRMCDEPVQMYVDNVSLHTYIHTYIHTHIHTHINTGDFLVCMINVGFTSACPNNNYCMHLHFVMSAESHGEETSEGMAKAVG